MRPISKEDKAGLYITVIVHLTVLIALLIAGLDYSLRSENSFVLDFSKQEEIERMQAEVERLQKEVELKESISRRLDAELQGLGSSSSSGVRNVAVDRGALKDDRGTDAEQLYKDAARLANELKTGFKAGNEDDFVDVSRDRSSDAEQSRKTENYSGPSVVSYLLEGRKASKLPIPAYRCMGAGKVTVLITVDPAGNVINAKVDDSVSSGDSCLRSFAIRAARLSRFSAKADANPRQSGNIVYEFIAQ